MRLPTCDLRTFFAVLLAFAGLSLPPAAAHAQQPALMLSRIGADSLPELKVYLSYLGADGKPLSGRAAGDFKLMVDAEEQGAASAITLFEKANEPISVVLLAPATPAVGDPLLTQIKAGFRRLAQTAGASPGSRVSVFGYSDTPKRLLESGSAAQVEGALAKLAVDPNATESHLLDALQAAINLLKGQAGGQRKLLVVVTDGLDVSQDKRSFRDLGSRAAEAGVVINTVGYNELGPVPLSNLQDMTKRSYGTTRVAKSPAEVAAHLGTVAEEIQKQYVATFRLSMAADNKEHTLQVYDAGGSKQVYSNILLVKPGSKQTAGKDNPPPPPPPHKLVIPVT